MTRVTKKKLAYSVPRCPPPISSAFKKGGNKKRAFHSCRPARFTPPSLTQTWDWQIARSGRTERVSRHRRPATYPSHCHPGSGPGLREIPAAARATRSRSRPSRPITRPRCRCQLGKCHDPDVAQEEPNTIGPITKHSPAQDPTKIEAPIEDSASNTEKRQKSIQKHERVRKVFFLLASEILSSIFFVICSRRRVDLTGGHGLLHKEKSPAMAAAVLRYAVKRLRCYTRRNLRRWRRQCFDMR